jgi:hypothetical protein
VSEAPGPEKENQTKRKKAAEAAFFDHFCTNTGDTSIPNGMLPAVI